MGQNIATKPDEEIASLVQAGNMELFGTLVLRYEKKIMRYAKKFLSGHEDIEDVVQEIFIKTYKNIKSFDAKRKFSTWLYRIAHNELVNALKKKKRLPLLFFNFDAFLPQATNNNTTYNHLQKKELSQMLNNCLHKLDPKYREPLILYYFDEMDYREISEVMQIPISTVGVRLKRGRETIRSILKDKL